MAIEKQTRSHTSWKHWRSTVINLGTIFALLLAVSFLPADTSLSQIKERGVLKLCVPERYEPFITTDEKRPGYDIELVKAIADELGVRLAVNKLVSIGRDFNPRNWMLSRGQCDMVAGGMADTIRLRNFMQTIPTNIELGWVLLSPDGATPQNGEQIYVIPGNTGLNRLELSGWIRNQGLKAQPVNLSLHKQQNGQQLIDDIDNGRVKGLVTENFTACSLLSALKDQTNIKATWLFSPDNPESSDNKGINTPAQTQSMALSLWKGDITLKKAVVAAMDKLQENGIIENLREFYIGDDINCVS